MPKSESLGDADVAHWPDPLRISTPADGSQVRVVRRCLTRWLHGDHLERQADGTYRTTEPIPMGGNWKSLLRLHDGRELAAVPIDLPEDAAIPAPAIPAGQGFTRPLQEEITIMQRERKQDVAGWLWPAAATLVLALYLAFLAALAGGVGRSGRAQEEQREDTQPPATERTERFRGATPVGA